jgi:hypothetical protein
VYGYIGRSMVVIVNEQCGIHPHVGNAIELSRGPMELIRWVGRVVMAKGEGQACNSL